MPGIGYSGINAKGWTSGQTVYAKDVFDKKANIYNEKFGVSYLHTDFLWNFSNAVSGYKETRTWNFGAVLRCRLGSLVRQRCL